MQAKFPQLNPDDASGDGCVPAGFSRAREIMIEAFAQCEAEQLPTHSFLAALATEFVPRLVAHYGPNGASLVLGTLTHTVLAESGAPTRQ
jgi:hypothetical protein